MKPQEIINIATAVGHDAARATTPTPMVVMRGDTSSVVEDGLCGFAYINIAGNTDFGRYTKKSGLARKCYDGGGLYISVPFFNQSYERKMAYATAFARVLNMYGVQASVEGRLD